MNHIYRVIFNHQTGTFQAVAETAKSVHKTSRGKYAKVFKAFLTPISLALSLAFGFAAHASPTGGQVTAGQAVINQNGLITNINQSSQNAAINWQSFNVGKNETVNFNQPNAQSVTLNRVIGNERSIIDGAMNANGKVFISNANGMLIGKDAKINVGSLVATTANISDDDLMNGRYQFTGEGAGSIENLGHISVPKGGVVALVAPIVKNGGTITVHDGNVLLASAESFSITLPDNANFAYTLDKGTLQGLVDNGGAILADAGRVVLTAKGVDTVKKSLIKHTGKIEANTVQNKNGVIELLGDLDNSALNVSGSLKAEGKASGDGGFIETSSAQLNFDDNAVISTKSETGQTGTWLIDPKDFTVAPSGGDITGVKVSEGLQSNNITLKSRDGAKEGKGDVIINDEISWDKNTLTLNAENDIHINKTMNGSGTAKLALEYGQGAKDDFDNQSNYYLQKDTAIQDRTVKINLPEGKTFTTKKGNDGKVLDFDVIHKMPEIIKNINDNWTSGFDTHYIALGTDINVSHTKNFEGFAGWEFNDNDPMIQTQIHGLGHAVDGLYLRGKKDGEYTGLFHTKYFVGNKNVRNIGVTNVDIHTTGRHSSAGALMGIGGNVSDSWATGKIATFAEGSLAGGLMGKTDAGKKVINSYAGVEISTQGDYANAGGLIGVGTVEKSFATGNVSTAGNYASAGGLVGRASDIYDSYATGNVSTQGDYANAGGLVGYGTFIRRNYATGNVNTAGKNSNAGGLVGDGSDIDNNYATGNVSSSGENSHAGGIMGYGSSISNNYFDGKKVSATGVGSYQGGVIGDSNNSTTYKNSFFNSDNNPNLQPIGRTSSSATVNNIAAKTTTELTQKSTFTDWDFDKIWYINDGETPKLHAHKKGTVVINPVTPPTNPTPTPVNKTDLAVQANNLNKVYDGETVATENDLRAIAIKNGYGDIVTVNGLKNGDTLDKLGVLTYNGSWKNAKNAGKYTIIPTGLTGGQDYEIKYGEGKLTIDKRPVKFTLSGEKVYDGKDTVTISLTTNKTNQEGILDKDLDKVTIQGTGTLTGKNAGVQQLKSVNNTLIGGELGGNYKVSDEIVGRWVIHKRPVELNLSGEKVYDGTNTISVLEKANATNQKGILDSELDKITFNGSGSLTGTNVGIHQLQGISETVIAGELGKNYEISKVGGQWQINKKPIAITATRIYDGTNNAISEEIDNNTVITDLQNKLVTADKGKLSNGNAVAIVGQGTLSTKNAGDKIAVSDTGTLKLFALTPADKAIMDNYELDLVNSHWTIKPADLVVTAVSDKKVYDGTQNSDKKPTIVGLKSSDIAEFGQRFTNKNVQGENNTQLFVVDGKIVDGNNGKNYTIIDKNAKGTITPAELTITAVSDQKVYDGTTNSIKKPTIIGLRAGDKAEFGQKFADKNVQGENQSILTPTGGKITDGNNGNNYVIVAKNSKGTIEPKTISVIATKVYDGSTTIDASRIDSDDLANKVATSDKSSIGVSGSLIVSDKNAGNNKVVVSGNNLQLFNDSSIMRNYKIDNQNSKVNIQKRPINLTLTKKADGSKRTEWGFGKLNGVELIVSNVINDEIGSPSVGDFVVETSSDKPNFYMGNSEVQVLSDIKISNNNYTFDPKESSIGVDILNKAGQSVVPDSEKPIKVIEENDPIFFGEQIDLIVASHYNGFDMGERKQKVYPDGSVNWTMPIYNTMDTTLEIQILDKYGNVIDRKYAEPHRPESSMFDSYWEDGESVIQDIQGTRPIQNVAVSEKTDIDITIPAGGSVRFTYNSKYAKVYNFIDPITELILEALPDGDEEQAKKLGVKILEQMVKNGSEELLVQTLKSGLNVFTEQGRQNTKLVVELIANTAMEMASVDGLVGFTLDVIDIESIAKKLLGKAAGGSVYALKELAEIIVTSLNAGKAIYNYDVNYSKYDVVLPNNSHKK